MLNLFFGLSSDEAVILETINTRSSLAAQASKMRNDSHLTLLKNNMIALHNCDLNDKVKEAELDNDFHRTNELYNL